MECSVHTKHMTSTAERLVNPVLDFLVEEITISIGYKDLYRNAKVCAGRPKPYKYHKSGRCTVVRHMERSHKKCEYCKLWGKGKFVWRPDKNKQDTQHGKAA